MLYQIVSFVAGAVLVNTFVEVHFRSKSNWSACSRFASLGISDRLGRAWIVALLQLQMILAAFMGSSAAFDVFSSSAQTPTYTPLVIYGIGVLLYAGIFTAACALVRIMRKISDGEAPEWHAHQ